MNIDDWLDIQGSYNSEYNMTVECSYNLNEISDNQSDKVGKSTFAGTTSRT